MLTKEEQDIMIIDNVRLVYSVLNKYHLNTDEYYDVGIIGLVLGARSFDSTKGFKPSTYLYSCIRNEVIGACKKRVEECSLNTLLGDSDTEWIDIIPDKVDVCNEVVNNVVNNDTMNEVIKVIETLSDQNKFIMYNYLGINGYNKKSQAEIGEIMGVSRQNIHSHVKRIKAKLRKEVKHYEY